MNMKKSIYYIGIATLSVIGLFACQMQEEMWGKKTEKEQVGVLTLNVEAAAPASLSTKAEDVNTANFAVVVQGKANTDVQDVKREYEKVTDVPEQVTLPVGDYVVSSHTPGKLEKQLTYPYYAGEKAMTINEGATSETTVKCTMQNSRIQMNYSPDFLSSFKTWNITVTDGSQALDFNQSNITPTPVYWYFGEEVKSVKVHISATTIEGNTITSERDFAKADASEGYTDVESNNFIGGDALIIDLKPTTSLIGNVTGITVAVSIIFENHTDPVPINVTDKEPETPNTPDTPTDPETPTDPDQNLPSLTSSVFDTGVTFSYTEEDYQETSIEVKAPLGIKKLVVIIDGGTPGFSNAVTSQGFTGEGKNIVDNAAMADIIKNVPHEGDTNYTFPISNFYGMMKAFGPTVDNDALDENGEPIGILNGKDGKESHVFRVLLTDSQNNTISKELRITITK